MAEPQTIQQAYSIILRCNIETGAAPHYTELARLLHLTPDQARDIQRDAVAAAAGCWISRDTDYLHSIAPFSNLPTQYRVTVEGEQKWYGQ